MKYEIVDVIKDLLTGKLKFATKEVVDNRRKLCDSCEVRNSNVCTACGCYLPIKTKLEKSECPLSLW